MPVFEETYDLTLSKPAQRSLREQVINNNISNLLASVNTRSLAVRGWTLAANEKEGSFKPKAWKQRNGFGTGAEYIYDIYLTIVFAADRKPEKVELDALLRQIGSRSNQPNFGKWQLVEVDGEPYEKSVENGEADAIGYAPVVIPDDWEDYFSHLFNLDDHIARIRCALEAGLMSDWNNRYHCALVGPPGCGKSDICQTIKSALGEDAVLEFDATATTAAGAIKELTEREILPRVLIVEEIEKADEKAMSFLLSVMDLRSQIRKTTARSTVQRDTKLFAIATVNDVPLFQKLQAGALASRFSNTIFFSRPNRDQLEMILNREVSKINGNKKWIGPTLDYTEKYGITDPRQVTAICLCGREKLVSGEYQAMLERTTSHVESGHFAQ